MMKKLRIKQAVKFLTIALFSIPFLIQAQGVLVNEGSVQVASGTEIHLASDLKNKGNGLIQNNGVLTVLGDLVNQGNNSLFTGQGQVKMQGSIDQNISGQVVDFYQLTIDNSATEVSLNTSINVTNLLEMQDGDLHLNGQNIDLGQTGFLQGETNDNRIYGLAGTIIAERILDQPSNENIAGLGLELNSTNDLGLTQLVRGHTPQAAAGNMSIERYYTIIPTNQVSSDLVFRYFEKEITNHTEVNLVAWQLDSGTWKNRGGSIQANNDLLANPTIQAFSTWTLSDEISQPLPVELLFFEAKVINNAVQLNWETESEINSAYFQVERSKNGIDFQSVDQVQAAGFSTGREYYDLLDKNPFNGLSYYRLKQVDRDGAFVFSDIKAIEFKNESISLYPNPVFSNQSISIQGLDQGTLKLYDMNGKLVFQQDFSSGDEVKLPSLAAGVYGYQLFDRSASSLGYAGKIVVLNH